jgi:hypothetical protein
VLVLPALPALLASPVWLMAVVHLPLGFDCVLDDGTTYSASGVHTWTNALVAAFGLGAVVLMEARGLATERRARAVSPAPPPAPRP